MFTAKKISASLATFVAWMLFMVLSAATIDSIGYAIGGIWIYVFGATGYACLGYGFAKGVTEAAMVWMDSSLSNS